MLPPILRRRLYRPLALPISSFFRNAMDVVARGTKMQPEPNPLIRMAHKNVHWPIERFASPNHRLASTNRENPKAMSQRLSILAVRYPMIGMATIAPMPRGLTAHLGDGDAYPSSCRQ